VRGVVALHLCVQAEGRVAAHHLDGLMPVCAMGGGQGREGGQAAHAQHTWQHTCAAHMVEE